MKWALVRTYYKHGEYQLIIFENSKSLREYLIEKLEDYLRNYDSYFKNNKMLNDLYFGDITLEKLKLDDIISLSVEYGNHIVDSQYGWGVYEK